MPTLKKGLPANVPPAALSRKSGEGGGLGGSFQRLGNKVRRGTKVSSFISQMKRASIDTRRASMGTSMSALVSQTKRVSVNG
eukprot:4211198-Pyramimonas_sp.AAC.1